MTNALTVDSLFAGIGGIELGLEWTEAFRTVWQVERDPYCQRVLAKHWPDAVRHEDVCAVGAANLAPVDLICGGFPCQDISNAGKRAGIDGERSGLWREYARIVRELRPRYVLVENVAALLGRGLGVVLGDLAACGYDAEWSVLSAQNVGAPHLRERLFVIAYAVREPRRIQPEPVSGSDGRTVAPHDGASQPVANPEGDGLTLSGAGDARRDALASRLQQLRGESRGSGADNGQMADADIARLEGLRSERAGSERSDPTRHVGSRGVGSGEALAHTDDAEHGRRKEGTGRRVGRTQATQGSSVLTRGSSSHEWWSVEPDVGRVAHGVPARVDRLRALGNAVVPQCAEFVGYRILELEHERITSAA
jgi:DNA (cytosine-5)-methyltransferase 1